MWMGVSSDLPYPNAKRVTIKSNLYPITPALDSTPSIDSQINYWIKLAYSAFQKDGFQPDKVVTVLNETLNGVSDVIRAGDNRLTDLIVTSMAVNLTQGGYTYDACIFQSGIVRIDDEIPPGPITQYDILRIMPYNNFVMMVNFTGALLRTVLDQGLANAANGGYLHSYGIAKNNGDWYVNGVLLGSRNYTLGVVNYLLSGAEINFKYLTLNNTAVTDLHVQTPDMRFGFIDYLVATYGPPPPSYSYPAIKYPEHFPSMYNGN